MKKLGLETPLRLSLLLASSFDNFTDFDGTALDEVYADIVCASPRD